MIHKENEATSRLLGNSITDKIVKPAKEIVIPPQK